MHTRFVHEFCLDIALRDWKVDETSLETWRLIASGGREVKQDALQLTASKQ